MRSLAKNRRFMKYGGGPHLSEEKTDKVGADQMLQHTEPFGDTQVCADELQTQVECLDGGTQVLDDNADALSNEIVDIVGSTQVIEDSIDNNWGSFEGEFQVSDKYKDYMDTESEDLEGDTQILDDPEDVFQNQLLCNEDLDELYNEPITINSSSEMEHSKSLTSSLVENTGYLNRSSGYVPPRFTEIRIESFQASAAAARSRLEKKNDELNSSTITSQPSEKRDDKETGKSGYRPLRFTEIRVQSLIASGLAARNKALNRETNGSLSSLSVSHIQHERSGKENEVPARVSPSSIEGTDDDYYSVHHEPKDAEFSQRKVKSSVVRKLFAEEVVSETEASGTRLSDDAETELTASEGDNDAAGLSYIHSQEPAELAQAQAINFVEKYLKANILDIDQDDHRSFHGKNTDSVAHGKCTQSLAKKNFHSGSFGIANAFDWDDENEDEGGGAFFCRMKEEIFKKESHLRKSLPSLQKSTSLELEQLKNIRGQSKFNDKKRKLSYSNRNLVSSKTKKIAKTFETSAKQNVSDGSNCLPIKEVIASQKVMSDIPVAGQGASVDASLTTEAQHLTLNNNQVNSDKTCSSECLLTRKRSIFKEYNLRKRAHSGADKVCGKSAQSMHISAEQNGGADKDIAAKVEGAKFVTPLDQPMEVSTEAGSGSKHISGKGNAHAPKLVTSEPVFSGVDGSHIGQTELVNPEQLKSKPSSRSFGGQTSRRGNNKDAKPRRPCRLKKIITNLDDSFKQKDMQGLDGCALEQSGLTMTEHLETNGQECRPRQYDEDNGSCINTEKQCKQSEIMTCTPVAQRTRRMSLRKYSSSAETGEKNVKSAESCPAKSCITTSCIVDDPVQVNSKEDHDKIRLAALAGHSVLEQPKPASSDKTVRFLVHTSSCRRVIKPRRSTRLSGSSTSDEPSSELLNKNRSTDASGKQQLFGTPEEDKVAMPEASSTKRAKVSCSECVTPTDSSEPSEEASPICMGNEYQTISCKPNPLISVLQKESDNAVKCPGNTTSPILRDSTKRSMTDVRVLFSQHLYKDTLEHQKKILDRLGSSVASSISDATHFIADKFTRTRNMLEAIALGKQVVTPLWLLSCWEARLYIDEKSHILCDEKNERMFGFSMPVSLNLARQQPLLQNQRVFITPNTKPSREVIACLVKAVRGQVIGRIGRSALRDNVLDGLLILTCEEDFAVCEPFLEKGATVYSSELLLNGIVTQRLEYERYRLFDDRVKRTRRTLWLKKDSKQACQELVKSIRKVHRR